jgi:hypothetical protein
MNTNPYQPPTAGLGDPRTRKGVSHWLAIPVGFLFSMLGVLVAAPLLADFIVQTVLSLPEPSRQTPVLLLDLALSASFLVGTIFAAGWWARDPRTRVAVVVALLVLAITVLMRMSEGLYEPNVMPRWYEFGVVGTIALAWWIARSLLLKRQGSISDRRNPQHERE